MEENREFKGKAQQIVIEHAVSIINEECYYDLANDNYYLIEMSNRLVIGKAISKSFFPTEIISKNTLLMKISEFFHACYFLKEDM